jgi:hypothetical protein
MRRTLLITFIILLITVAACKKSLPLLNEQQVMFQVEYVNYVSGYDHGGFIIDGEGNIMTYDNPEKWNFPDDNFMLTAEQLKENLQFCEKSGKVTMEEVARYGAYIENISMSKVSGIKNTGNDAGTVQFICYKSSGASEYKGTLVRMEGDFTCENLNFYSKKVVSWLKEINTSLRAN